MARRNDTTAFRFWAKVNTNGPVPAHAPKLGQCWIWTAARDKNGYGKAHRARPHPKRNARAHRISWELMHCPVPPGMLVLHRCDNPSCVRPSHLWLGTNQDNMADMARKGRQASGDRHGSRLHPEALAFGDRNGSRLYPERLWRGEHHYSTMYPERRPRGDAHFSRTRPELLARGERNGSARMTEAKVREIRRRVAEGERRQIVANEFGIAITTVSAIIRRLIWKHVP